MNSEQYVKTLPLSKRAKQSEHLTSDDTEEFEQPKTRGLNPRPLLRTIKRNILLIAGVTTVVAAAAFLHSSLTSPRSYEGDFRLLVEPITSEGKYADPSVISRDGRDGGGNTTTETDYPTLLQLLQSPGLLSKIAKQIQSRYPDFSYNSFSRDLLVQRIGTNLTDSTKLIQVRYKGSDPKKVQFVLEELAKGYLNYSLEDRKKRIGSGVTFIEEQLPRLQQQVDTLEEKVQALQERYNLNEPTSNSAELSKQANAIEEQKLATQRELREQNALYNNLQKQLKLTPDEVIPASTLSQDPGYQDTLAQLKKIESQIAVESARFTERSSVIQTLRDKQKNLSQLLNQQAQQLVGSKAKNPQVQSFQSSIRQGLIKQLVDTANQVQVLEVRNQALIQNEVSLNQELKQLPAIIRQYNDLQRRLEIATKTLNQFLIQRETLRVDAAQKTVPWEIVSAPSIPRDPLGNPIPDPSKTSKSLIMAVIAGFALGLGAAILKEKSRNIFYTSEDIQDAVELPLLGVIPLHKPNYSNASLFTEAFNSLYTNIRFLANEPPVRSLVVSSAAPGDGKTTIALHLAQVAASMGQRVLLVDANLRLPQLHNILGLQNALGLSNLLSQTLEPSDLIQHSLLQDNLFVLTAGQLLPDSTKMFGSAQMQHLMSQFQSTFDLVIYDTSHLGLTDANYMAVHTDGILMVVGVNKTSRSLVMQVVEKLNTLRLPILGIVTNYLEAGKKSSDDRHNSYYEQNHQVGSSLDKQPKLIKTPLLASVKETDDALR